MYLLCTLVCLALIPKPWATTQNAKLAAPIATQSPDGLAVQGMPPTCVSPAALSLRPKISFPLPSPWFTNIYQLPLKRRSRTYRGLTTYLGRPPATHWSPSHHPQADSMSLTPPLPVWPSVTLSFHPPLFPLAQIEALGIFYFHLFIYCLSSPPRFLEVELPTSNQFPASNSQAELEMSAKPNLDRQAGFLFSRAAVPKGKLTSKNESHDHRAVLAPQSST